MPPQEHCILVPLDGSAFAEQALPYAVALARATNSSLLLAQVIVPDERTVLWLNMPYFTPAASEHWMETGQTWGHNYLRRIAHQLIQDGVAVRTEVLFGADVAAALVARAVETPSMIAIAMATHGRTGIQHVLVGSVAESILRVAPVPLLLVRPQAEQPATHSVDLDTIMIPLDGSSFAEQALLEAQPIVVALNPELVLLGVGTDEEACKLADGGIEPSGVRTERQAADQQLSEFLIDRALQLQERGYSARPLFVRGDPASEIVRASIQEQVGLIIMATHGRTGLRRRWLGSVALKVVQNAPVPVLLIRAREDQRPLPRTALEIPQLELKREVNA